MRRKSKIENPIEILFGRDHGTFHRVVLQNVFKEYEPFEVRKDIEIPKKEGDNGVILSFNDGRIGYFKTQSVQLTPEEYESILKVCYFLQDKYGGSIKAYVLCRPEVELRAYECIDRDDITLMVVTLKNYDGDSILDTLQNKLDNKERFTAEDHIWHILLPYLGYKDRDVFLPKYQHYMMETMLDNAEKQGIEVVRL